MMAHGRPSQNDRMLEGLTRRVADKARLVAINADIVAAQAYSIANKAYRNANKPDLFAVDVQLIYSQAQIIYRGHSEFKSLLSALRADRNQATLLAKENEESSSTHSLDKTRFSSKGRSSPTKFDELCNPPVLEWDKIDFLHTLTSDQMDFLALFYEHLQRVFRRASMLDGDDVEYQQKIKRTVNWIIGWNVGESMEASSTTEFYIPGSVGQETDGVQPILYAIMVKMAHLLAWPCTLCNVGTRNSPC